MYLRPPLTSPKAEMRIHSTDGCIEETISSPSFYLLKNRKEGPQTKALGSICSKQARFVCKSNWRVRVVRKWVADKRSSDVKQLIQLHQRQKVDVYNL